MTQGAFRIVKNGASPKASPSPTLSQITSRLIERWDEMSEEEKLAVMGVFFVGDLEYQNCCYESERLKA